MYAARRTVASEPMMAGPFSATTGHSRQNTPNGDSARISSMTFMNTSLRSLNAATMRWFFSSPMRMMPKPSRIAMTMI